MVLREATNLFKSRAYNILTCAILALLIFWAGPFGLQKAYGAQIISRSLKPSSSNAGEHNVAYQFAFTPGTSGFVGSIEFQFCSNSALIDDPCTAPYGLDVLNANLTSQTGTTGFMKAPGVSANDIVLTQNPPLFVNSNPVTFTFDNIINPTDEGSYFVKIFTYANTTATGVPVDFGAMAFPINHSFSVSAEVPPYLTFCGGVSISGFNCSTAGDDVIDFGQFSSAVSSAGQSQLVAATNAGSGYAIYVNGTTMTSGNNVLPAMQNDTSKVGVSQFGINLRNNTSPNIGENITGPGTGTVTANYNQVNRYRFTAGENIATATQAQDFRKYTVSYVVNVDKNQAPGVYSTTLTYVCLANF